MRIMATITLSNAVYNNAKFYAERHNLSVDEFVVMLINRFSTAKDKGKKFEMLPIESLDPQLQDILNMPRKGMIDSDDVNGEEARMEYYREKYTT
jgi:hypothetical protein